jgi:AcrR family transcriptional regulator
MSPDAARKRLTREESQAQTRERLVLAARALFVRQGFGAASIRDIAEEAGYSQGAFYSNFAGKEAVLLELLRRHMDEETEQLTAVLETTDEARLDVLARLEHWAETLNTDADWSMLAIELQLHANRSPSFAAEYVAVREAHRAALGRLVRRLFDRLGLVPPVAPDELAASFMALAHGLALQRAGIGPDPAGKMIMVFLRALIASAKSR